MSQIYTFRFQTKCGEAEACIVYERLERSLFDRLLGRERIKYGIGLCSPRDLSGVTYQPQLEIVDGVFKLNLGSTPRYKPGLTERIALGRFKFRGTVDLNGKVSVDPIHGADEVFLRALVLLNTPKSWWNERVKCPVCR